MKSWKKIGGQFSFVLAALALLAGNARGQYTFMTIDDPVALASNGNTYVTGIWSNIVVGYYFGPDLHGFYHQLGTTNYTTLDVPYGYTNNSSFTQINGISGSNIVGTYQNYSYGASGYYGFIYNMATSNFTTLDDTNAGTDDTSLTYATGIDGTNIVGEDTAYSLDETYYESFVNTTSVGGYDSFYYPSPTVIQNEGLYTNYTYTTRVLGISGSNVVGYWLDENPSYHGFIYNTGTATYTSVVSPSEGGCPVTCIDGSNVAGYYGDPNYSYNASGYIFNTATSNYIASIRDPLAVQDTYLMGISGATVVGYYLDNSNTTHGFVAVPSVITPQIEIFQGTTPITNNQTSAVSLGSAVLGQTGPIANFTVTNTGGTTLYLTNISAPAGFSVLPGFPTSVAVAASGAFSVQLDSNNVGNFSGNVVITNSDPNSNPFTFAISGSVSNAVAGTPQIEIFSWATASQIANNQLNAVNLGVAIEGQLVPESTFTVTNPGSVTLYLTNISVPAGFTLVSGFSTSVAAGSTGGFGVELDSASVGNFSGNVVITNSDPNNNPFSFGISGSVTAPAVTELLSLTASPAGGGTVSAGGANGGGLFPQGSQQTITPSPGAGYEFIGWSGDATGTANPLTVTVNTPLSITANFAPAGASNITILVITNGGGAITPNLNGHYLLKNKIYTLRATASNGNVFSNWTGSIVSDKTPLSFKAETNILLQANFVPNPFLSTKGIYNGLFSAGGGVAEATAGMLKGLTVNAQGHYSGTLLNNGASRPISGSFDLGGHATNTILRPLSEGGPLLLEMTLSNPGDAAPEVTGTIYGTNNGAGWISTNLLAYYATNTLPAAEYSMLIPPDVNNTPPNGSPGGDGYALITNNPGPTHNPAAATAKITGALADGTAFNQTVPVSQEGWVPVYASLYGGKGLLLGWINLDLTNTSAIAGTSLTWIHPKQAMGLYQKGFTNVVLTNQIVLSMWTNPPGSFAGLNLSLLGTINDEAAITNISVSVNSAGKITAASAQGTINLKTGLVTVTVTVGSGPAKVTGHGVMLNTTDGSGYYLTKTNTAQALRLGP